MNNTYWLSAVVVVVLSMSDASAMRGNLINTRGRFLQQSYRMYKNQLYPFAENFEGVSEIEYKASLQYPFYKIYKQAIDKARQEVVNQGHAGVDRYGKTYAIVKKAIVTDLACLNLLIDDQSLMMSGEDLLAVIVQLEKDASGDEAYYPANVRTICAREFYSMIIKHDDVNDFFEKNMLTIIGQLNPLQVNKLLRSPYFKPFLNQVRHT